MQRIDIIHEENRVVPVQEEYTDYESVEEDFITDEDEIRAIIRRAVTISWEDSIFTLDELHARLMKNFVKYPVPEGEEYGWLEDTVYELWREQKEKTLAGTVLPTMISVKVEGKRHYGIVRPTLESEEVQVKTPQADGEDQAGTIDEPMKPVLVAEPKEEAEQPDTPDHKEPDIAPPPLLPSEIAAHVFEKYLDSKEERPKFEISYLMNLFRDTGLNAQPKDIRNVVKSMAESGYIQSYMTGKNKGQRTWWYMDADVKADVLTDIEDDSFYESLPDMFDGEEAVA